VYLAGVKKISYKNNLSESKRYNGYFFAIENENFTIVKLKSNTRDILFLNFIFSQSKIKKKFESILFIILFYLA
jgi:hypothetical protein